jgi:DNA polymerase-3 subunit epsilon
MILFLDTETTGLVQESLPHDHPAQPHLVQLGCLLTDDDGRTRATVDLIVKPEGYVIPKGASDVHGVTQEIALRCGLPLVLVVGVFVNLRARADVIVAHNLPFDERVMATAIHRTGKRVTLPSPVQRVCTVELAEPILKIPPTPKMLAAGMTDRFKRPNLKECYKFFFDEELVGAHNAVVDAGACAKVYFQIKSRGGERIERKGWLQRFIEYYQWGVHQ